MSQIESSSISARPENYALGYDKDVVSKINQRAIGREGAFVLRLLRPGMTLLDVGCGPGSITLGLANAIAPGIVTGIDIDAGQIELSKAAAEQAGASNTQFQVADAHQLPFEDNSFDVIFGHTVFMHLARPDVAMKELFRVCKPGGFIAIREGLDMFERLSTVSMNGADRSFSEFMRELTRVGNGHSDIGLRLKGLLHGAGFCHAKPGTHNEVYHTASDLIMLESWFRSLFQGKLGQSAVEKGMMSQVELDEAIAKMQGWVSNPGSICIVSWIEYLALKPGAPAP